MIFFMNEGKFIYKIYDYWVNYFSLKSDDDEELSPFIFNKFTYNNGKVIKKEGVDEN